MAPPAPQPALDRVAAAHIAENPLYRAPVASEVRALAASIAPGSRVLDAGAGAAPYRALFDRATYVTADWPSSLHAGAAGSDILGDLAALPSEDGSFDVILSTEVLEHVFEPREVLAEFRRVLVPGGRLLITVPFVIALHEQPDDFARYTSFALEHMLAGAGFIEIEVVPLSGAASVAAMINARLLGGLGAVLPLPSVLRRAASRSGDRSRRMVYRAARRLDAYDRQRSLPLGWAARARTP